MRSNGYSAGEAKVLLESLGEEGRNVYLHRYIPLDMAFILIYLPLWSLILAFLFKKGFKPESRIHYFVVIPLFIALFDFLENTGIAIMLSIYPGFSSSLAGLAGILTVIKNYLAIFFYVLVFIGIVGWIINRGSWSIKQIIGSHVRTRADKSKIKVLTRLMQNLDGLIQSQKVMIIVISCFTRKELRQIQSI